LSVAGPLSCRKKLFFVDVHSRAHVRTTTAGVELQRTAPVSYAVRLEAPAWTLSWQRTPGDRGTELKRPFAVVDPAATSEGSRRCSSGFIGAGALGSPKLMALSSNPATTRLPGHWP
jgi:hypothetical protein